MNPADYDQYLPELLAAANRVADDLDRIAALPPTAVTRSELQHHDSSDDGSKRNYIAWIRHEDTWTTEDQTRTAKAADWLRNDLPGLAARVVGTEGIDEDDDEDLYRQLSPRWISGVLRTPFVLDADGQTSFWRPEDVQRATYGDRLYDQTAAAYLWQAWDDFVTRINGGGLHFLLEGITARLGRPGVARITDTTGNLDDSQRNALAFLNAAVADRSLKQGALLAADRTVAENVRACLDEGVSVIELARRLSVTRARIYQIRDGRR